MDTLRKGIRARQVSELIGSGVSTVWRLNKERHDFPKPRRIGSRMTVWDMGEVLAWRDAQLSKGA